MGGGWTLPIDHRADCLGPKLGTNCLPLGFVRGTDWVQQFSKPSPFPTSMSRGETLAKWEGLVTVPAHPLKTERDGCLVTCKGQVPPQGGETRVFFSMGICIASSLAHLLYTFLPRAKENGEGRGNMDDPTLGALNVTRSSVVILWVLAPSAGQPSDSLPMESLDARVLLRRLLLLLSRFSRV